MGSGQYVHHSGPPKLLHDPASPFLPILCKRMWPSWRSLIPAALHALASTLIHTHVPFQPHSKRGAGVMLPVSQAEALAGQGLCPKTARIELRSALPSVTCPHPTQTDSPALILKRAPGCVCPGSWQPPLCSFSSSPGYNPKLFATIHLFLLFKNDS